MKKVLLFGTLFFAAHALIAQYSFDDKKLVQDLRMLSSEVMAGRKTGTDGSRKARIFIIERLKQLGVERFVPGYEQPFSLTAEGSIAQGAGGTNVLGVINGTKKSTIVISAHYDHLGVRGTNVFYGADDNASGTAALLAFAEYFKKHAPEHRIVLAFFDAEEMGLRGSAHFVSSADVQNENIILNINMDMVARGDDGNLYACGTHHYPQLKPVIENIEIPDGLTLVFGKDTGNSREDWTMQSDQGSFHRKKIPFIYFGVDDHPDYHKTSDSFDKIDTTFYAKSVETILRAAVLLDKQLD